jgi:patatin-like phospholipase/acyl hydrolase
LPGATTDPELPSSSRAAILPEDDLNNFRIHHYFDYIAGTSTGG